MTSVEMLMSLYNLILGNGGVNFIKIRLLLEDLDHLADKGDANAIQFKKELYHVYILALAATKREFV